MTLKALEIKVGKLGKWEVWKEGDRLSGIMVP